MRDLGIIVGKFLPPHRGHDHPIDVAASQVSHLVVFVCSRPPDPIPADLRAGWLRELHDRVDVRVVDDPHEIDEDDSRLWASAAMDWLGRRPDVAFTSEDYGPRWAHAMGCAHVMVDRWRTAVPCSGTMVRADPLASWEYLAPSVRAHYALRVCVVGAESTGTTTLAGDLAAHYWTVCVAEYGREYWIAKHARDEADWTTAEFIHIAQEQARREDAAARVCNSVLVCDTDAWATATQHERYVGSRSAEFEEVADARRRPDLYVLTDMDAPFVQDGTRDGERLREWMHGRFVDRLEQADGAWVMVSGSREVRLRSAVAAVDGLIAGRRKVTMEPSPGGSR